MDFPLIITVACTVAALILFLTEALRVDLVAILVMVTLLVCGILEPAEALSGFSNEATLTIAAMFVLSEAFRKTGALNFVGTSLGNIFAVNEVLGLLTLMTSVAALSAFINNTAVVAVLLPVMLTMCRERGIAVSRVLMPLSFSAMFGGLCTLVGTSTNLLVSSLLAQHGMERIGMFEMAVPGLVFFLVGSLYMITIGRWLTPARRKPNAERTSHELPSWIAEVELCDDAIEVGQSVLECNESGKFRIIGVMRNNEECRSLRDLVLQAGDVLRIRGTLGELQEVDKRDDLVIQTGRVRHPATLEGTNLIMFEAVVDPDAELSGRSLLETDFNRRFTADVLALRSRGTLRHARLTQQRLRGGDVLLMQAPASELERLQNHPAFVVVSAVGAPELKKRAAVPVALLIAAAVALAAFGILPIVASATAAAALVVLFGLLDIEEAYDAIDWQVIVLLAGILPLGLALEEVGAVEWTAKTLVEHIGTYGPLALLAGFYLITTFSTDLISNQATAILLTPIAIGAATSIGADPRVFVMAVAFAASASFASPVGYQTNVLIYGAGDYRFTDFVKVGLPLNLLFWGVAVYFLPQFWSF